MISLRLLGCNGGIGGSERQTTCYQLGDSVLIDAGTGLGTLPLEQMLGIDHVVLTHAHLDHIACLPLLVDSVAGKREQPVQVWALPEVIDILSEHIFNEKIWPDFTKIPSPDAPFMTLNALQGPLEVAGMRLTPLPAQHGIPACGYRVEKEGVSIAFSGDTEDCAGFWQQIAADSHLKAVIVECSYPESMAEMANISMHLQTSAIAARLAELPPAVISVIIHRKPGFEEQIDSELKALLNGRELRIPTPGTRYEFS